MDELVSEALFLGVLPLHLFPEDGVVEVNGQFVITGLGKEAALIRFLGDVISVGLASDVVRVLHHGF